MAYTSLPALLDRIGTTMLVQLTDRGEVPTGAIDQAVVDRALADTDAVIDASLAVRYQLPLAAVPAIVADLAGAIAVYKLHRFAPEAKVQADYDQALRDLRELASGAKKLDVAGVEPSASGVGGVLAIDRERPFTPENLRGFI